MSQENQNNNTPAQTQAQPQEQQQGQPPVQPQAQLQPSFYFQYGPLPPPEILARYDDALPGTSEKIVAAFNNQTNHRLQIENEQMDLKRRQMDLAEQYAKMDSRNSLLGICVAAFFGFSVMAVGAFLVYNGYAVGGSLFSGVGLGAIIGTFVYGTRIERKTDKKQ